MPGLELWGRMGSPGGDTVVAAVSPSTFPCVLPKAGNNPGLPGQSPVQLQGEKKIIPNLIPCAFIHCWIRLGGIFFGGGRQQEEEGIRVLMCSANPWIFGVVWHWSFYPRLINVQIQTPINPKSLGMDVVAGNCAVPAEGAFGTFPQHSQHPNPTQPWL